MTDPTCACGAACPADTAVQNGIARVDASGATIVAPGVRPVDAAKAATLEHICPLCWATANAPKVVRTDGAEPKGARMDRMG